MAADPGLPLFAGDVVLDLASGDGSLSFLAARLVGPRGRVLGVEEDPAALAQARCAAPVVAGRLGCANVRFRRGRSDDLALDAERLDRWLASHPVRSAETMAELASEIERLRREEPLVAEASCDVVITKLDERLVAQEARGKIVQEVARVLRPGGRLVIVDGDRAAEGEVFVRAVIDPARWREPGSSACVKPE